jgi:hypothetical protein
MIHQPPSIIYEELLASYSSNLEVQTRGFSAGESWLESWVPDEDIVPSLLNLVEAAQIGGLEGFSLKLSLQTLSPLAPEEVCRSLGHLADVTMDVHDGMVSLVLTDLQKALHRQKLQSYRPDPGEHGRPAHVGAAWVANASLQTGKTPALPVLQVSEMLPENAAIFSDVRESYRAALRGRHGAEMFAVPPPEGAAILESEAGRFWLVSHEKSGVVEAAGFEPKAASPSLSAAMDCLCELIRGLPLPEIREHAIVRLEYLLRDKSKKTPVMGIILPQNADPIFAKARSLLDRLLAKAGATPANKINFYDRKPAPAWKAMAAEEREQACRIVAEAHSAGLLGYEQGIRVVDAHRPYAVTVKFEGEAPVAQKRRAALDLEKIFRAKCDPRLEVFCLEMKDASQLRRL